MASPIRTANDLIDIEYGHFWIYDQTRHRGLGDIADNGLIARSSPGQAAILTGLQTGSVRLRVEFYKHVPTLLSDEWDEIVEFTLFSIHGLLMADSTTGRTPNIPVLSFAGPGAYRIRIHARGRDITHDLTLTVSDPVEDYLIQVWPTGGDENDPITVHTRRTVM